MRGRHVAGAGERERGRAPSGPPRRRPRPRGFFPAAPAAAHAVRSGPVGAQGLACPPLPALRAAGSLPASAGTRQEEGPRTRDARRPGQVRAAASAAVRKSRYSPFTGLSASNCVWPSPCRRTGRRVRRHALPRPQVLQLRPGPEFTGRARARAGGWHEWTPVVSAKGTRGWGALDPELRPPRRGAEPARGRGPDGDGGAASSGRSWARSAPATTPIPPGAKPAECNLVLKGNAPLHAC